MGSLSSVFSSTKTGHKGKGNSAVSPNPNTLSWLRPFYRGLARYIDRYKTINRKYH